MELLHSVPMRHFAISGPISRNQKTLLRILSYRGMRSWRYCENGNRMPSACLVDRVGSPVKCIPIGKTSKGELVYSWDCRDIPVAIDQPQPVAPTVPETIEPKMPVSK